MNSIKLFGVEIFVGDLINFKNRDSWYSVEITNFKRTEMICGYFQTGRNKEPKPSGLIGGFYLDEISDLIVFHDHRKITNWAGEMNE